MKKTLQIFLGLLIVTNSVFALEVGDKAAKFANMDLSGKFEFSKNYIGTDWIIVDFFATYCIPCKAEIPELEMILEDFKESPLKCFVMATDKDGGSIVKPYFNDTPTTLNVLIDRYMVTAKRFGVESIPTVFLIDNNGKIVFKSVGYSEESINEIRSILTKAFSD